MAFKQIYGLDLKKPNYTILETIDNIQTLAIFIKTLLLFRSIGVSERDLFTAYPATPEAIPLPKDSHQNGKY